MNYNPIAIKIGSMEDVISTASQDKYFVEEETPKFKVQKSGKELKNVKTQDFADENKNGEKCNEDISFNKESILIDTTNKKHSALKFKKTNTVATQSFEEMSSKGLPSG